MDNYPSHFSSIVTNTSAQLSLSLLCLSLGALVTQVPRTVTAREGDTVTLNCHQKDTAYQTMLWYLQPHQGGLTLIGYGYLSNPTMEDAYKLEYEVKQTDDYKNCSLEIKKATQEGVYYCAAREGHSVRERQISRT
uniref:Ig-like domain-containing protein n=1 Tax=Callorhinchus milii TaxID=7868 RepID=A0A4W3HAP8_CALMI